MGVVQTAAGLRASFEARRACWGAKPGALRWQPPPPARGDRAAGRRLVNGLLLFDGALHELEDDASPWEITPPGARWSDILHGHGWIDDLACLSDGHSRRLMARWVHQWIGLYGQGVGPGWAPQLAARRLVRWVAHATDVLNGASEAQSHAFFRALSAHARYLDRLWRQAPAGIARIETVAGMLFGRVSLEGGLAPGPGVVELGRSAAAIVDPDGGIESRNPQDLLGLIEILDWSAEIVRAAGLEPDPRHISALSRMRPALAALVHANGHLARFHGARASEAGAVATALGAPSDRTRAHLGALGYARMAAGEATVIVDTAPPPRGRGLRHASALAFELTSGPAPVIVNAGSGLGFGEDRAVEGASTLSHSTVSLRGESHPVRGPGQRPVRVAGTVTRESDGLWLMGESRAWVPAYGLVHERRLHLDPAGTALGGEDTFVASAQAERSRLNEMLPPGLASRWFEARFVIHPDADVRPALNGRAALIVLPGGGRWMLRTDASEVVVRPGQYHDPARVHPRATKLIVVTGEILEYWGRITWSLEQLP
ncbi:MAG: heparinase II/III family protein [Pseudomonadota bacterium]